MLLLSLSRTSIARHPSAQLHSLKASGQEPSAQTCWRRLLWLMLQVQLGLPSPHTTCPAIWICCCRVHFQDFTMSQPGGGRNGHCCCWTPQSESGLLCRGPLPGTQSWGCADELQEEPEEETHRIMDGVWSQAEISTSCHLSSHRELRGRSGLNVAVIDQSPGVQVVTEVPLWVGPSLQ